MYPSISIDLSSKWRCVLYLNILLSVIYSVTVVALNFIGEGQFHKRTPTRKSFLRNIITRKAHAHSHIISFVCHIFVYHMRIKNGLNEILISYVVMTSPGVTTFRKPFASHDLAATMSFPSLSMWILCANG